jgi:putative NADH-flavin reductase
MRITVFGATGGTGTLVVRQALAAGHDVTAIVRDPARLPVPAHDRLGVVTADVMDPAAILPAVEDRDAIVTAIGVRAGGASTTVCRDSARSIVAAMTKAGTRRLGVVSNSGMVTAPGDDPLTRFVVKPLLWRVLGGAWADQLAQEDEVHASGLDWTIVRPPRLTDGARTRHRARIDRAVPGGFLISRAATAAAVLTAVADPSLVGHHVHVAY